MSWQQKFNIQKVKKSFIIQTRSIFKQKQKIEMDKAMQLQELESYQDALESKFFVGYVFKFNQLLNTCWESEYKNLRFGWGTMRTW